MRHDDIGRNAPAPGRTPGPGEDLVEQLVRLAAESAEVPAGTAERAKERLRPLWLAEVRSRRRTRALWSAAALAAAAAIVLVLGGQLRRPRSTAAPARVATVTVVVGALDAEKWGGASVRLGNGDSGVTLTSRTVLRTGAGDRAALDLGRGRSLRIDESSELRLEAAGVVTLERGAVYVDSGGAGSGGVEVRTAFGVAREIGTQFEVRLNDVMTVSVREGRVVVRRADAEREVAAGARLTVARDGSVQTRTIPPHDPAWAWTQLVAAPFAIEGRPAAELIAWAARESGLTITYANREAESTARSAVLHGALAGLAPRGTLDAALPSCGLRAEQRDATLVISRLPEAAREGRR